MLMCQDITNLLLRLPKKSFRTVAQGIIDDLEEKVQILDPSVVKEKKGRPSLKALSSTKREPSRFEEVEKALEASQKGKKSMVSSCFCVINVSPHC